jgi:hypothetical protein
MIAYAFDDGHRAALADRKTFVHLTRDEDFAAGRAIQDRVASQHRRLATSVGIGQHRYRFPR